MPYSSFLAGFEGMWRRPLSDYEKGVKEYLVTLDTNVLLNLYRFTPQARNELLSVLRTLQDRLWVSHQVTKEYYSRRMTAVSEHINLYTSVPKALTDSKNKAIQELNTFAKRRSMSPEDRAKLVDPLSKAFEAVTAEIKIHGQDFDLSLAKVATNDPILEALAEILDQKTGVAFREQEVQGLLEEYARRASKEIPPGYKDANKAENSHGDFFFWEQVLREAAERKRPVLLVTNDAKEDWVQLEAGITIGPRPELMEEFKDRCGLDFLLTDLGTFLKVAKSELGAAVSESTVAQAENTEQAAPGDVRERIMIPSEDYDAVVDELINARSHFSRVISNPQTGTSVSAAATSARNLLEDVLVEVKVPASRTADARFVYTDPTVWEKLQRAQRATRSSRAKRIQRSGSDGALVRQSKNLQERLQRMHWERERAMDDLQEVEELMRLENEGVNLEQLLESHETLSEKLRALQDLERELSERLHDVQLQLRSSSS